jgi:hypothetical protein
MEKKMTVLQWRGKPLTLPLIEKNEGQWLALDGLVEALEAHLQDLPGGAVGFCLADDICLPLGQDDLALEGGRQFVRLAALASLGIAAGSGPTAPQMLLGDPMPALTFTTLEGSAFSLSALPQKPTLLFAWASW